MPAAKPSPRSGKIAPLPRRDKAVNPDPPAAVFEADPDIAGMIERAAGYGMTASEIGYLIGIPTKEVEAYTEAMAAGLAKAKFKVSDALFRTAVDREHRGHVTASIFWLKARADWVEARPAEDGAAVPAPIGPRRELEDDEIRERFDATLAGLRPKSRQDKD